MERRTCFPGWQQARCFSRFGTKKNKPPGTDQPREPKLGPSLRQLRVLEQVFDQFELHGFDEVVVET